MLLPAVEQAFHRLVFFVAGGTKILGGGRQSQLSSACRVRDRAGSSSRRGK
jgi:hypothetical protein